MPALVFRARFPCPPEEAFRRVADIEGLGRYFPGTRFRRHGTGPLQEGEEYEAEMPLLPGLRRRTVWRIRAVEPGRRLAGALVSGLPLRLAYDHRLEPEGEGTRSVERVEYSLPRDLPGALLARLLVGPIVRKTLGRAYRRLAEDLARPANACTGGEG